MKTYVFSMGSLKHELWKNNRLTIDNNQGGSLEILLIKILKIHIILSPNDASFLDPPFIVIEVKEAIWVLRKGSPA